MKKKDFGLQLNVELVQSHNFHTKKNHFSIRIPAL